MEKTNFENLHIYRLSERLAEQIWRIVLGWEYFAKNTVGIQIVKAADSVGANIAEGSGLNHHGNASDAIKPWAHRSQLQTDGDLLVGEFD